MPTTFHRGPADGKVLSLQRAPLFLRVVLCRDGSVDALDQPDDSPRANEQLFAYRRSADHGEIHLQLAGPGGRGRRGRTESRAEYTLIEPQPEEAHLRDRLLWESWCMRQYQAEQDASERGPL